MVNSVHFVQERVSASNFLYITMLILYNYLQARESVLHLLKSLQTLVTILHHDLPKLHAPGEEEEGWNLESIRIE